MAGPGPSCHAAPGSVRSSTCAPSGAGGDTMGPMKGRILVVDDDVALAEMIGIVLRSEGFEPLFCAHGDDALEAFRSGQPDLVLLDLMLPGKDGTEICRLIRGCLLYTSDAADDLLCV